ncbi:hypothetical protein GJ496_010817 [Pomphorhynchus laevis]|nr:hypothetical protein GJ496_010817 [Pomphorhynchus laevis]
MRLYFDGFVNFITKMGELVEGRPSVERNLDFGMFRKTMQIPYIITQNKNVNLVRHLFRKDLLSTQNTLRIVEFDPNTKKIRLDPNRIVDKSSFDKYKEKVNLDEIVDKFDFEEITLSYDDLGIKDCINMFLADKNIQSPNLNSTGHKIIGHIIQINLRDELLIYRYQIGKILLDKNRLARTIVNKSGKINNLYRNLDFELIAGEPDYVTKCKENGITYHLDFSKVYWNPNLGTERERIVECIKAGDYVYDVFAGVGPFAIPLALRGCNVYANDWNPDCAYYLKYNFDQNIKQLKVGSFEVFNMDGHEFLRDVVVPQCSKNINHVIMNLPETSVSFLCNFRNLNFDNEDSHLDIYCYAFTADDQELEDIVHKELVDHLTNIKVATSCRYVRNVSPNKMVVCCKISLRSYRIEHQVDNECTTNDPPSKRSKCS